MRTEKPKFMRTAFPKGTAYGVVPLTAQESGGSANTATPIKKPKFISDAEMVAGMEKALGRKVTIQEVNDTLRKLQDMEAIEILELDDKGDPTLWNVDTEKAKRLLDG